MATIDCCDHMFCTDCIKKWAEIKNCCPNCRKRFTKIFLHKNIDGKRADETIKRADETIEVEDKDELDDDEDGVFDTLSEFLAHMREGLLMPLFH